MLHNIDTDKLVCGTSAQNTNERSNVNMNKGNFTLLEIITYPIIMCVVVSILFFVIENFTPFVEVAEIHVKAGQTVEAGDPLISLVLDDRSSRGGIPKVVLAPIGGKVLALNAEVGDKIQQSKRVMHIVNEETFEEVEIDVNKLISSASALRSTKQAGEGCD